jgi:hypothetical protein
MPKKTKIKQAFCLRPKQQTDVVDKNAALRVLGVLKKGIVNGLGNPIPGQMCVEAAVSYAMGYEHSDKPRCVSDYISDLKIALNDRIWSSNFVRARGLRRVAIAQLGSDEIEDSDFAEAFYRAFLRRLLPVYTKLSRIKKRNLKQNSTFQIAEKAITNILRDIADGEYPSDGESLADQADDILSSLNLRQALGLKGGLKVAHKPRYRSRVFAYIAEVAVDALKATGAKGTRYLYLIKKHSK